LGKRSIAHCSSLFIALFKRAIALSKERSLSPLFEKNDRAIALLVSLFKRAIAQSLVPKELLGKNEQKRANEQITLFKEQIKSDCSLTEKNLSIVQ